MSLALVYQRQKFGQILVEEWGNEFSQVVAASSAFLLCRRNPSFTLILLLFGGCDFTILYSLHFHVSCFVYSRNIGSLSVVQYLARKGIKWSDEEFVRISELTRCWGSRHKSSNIPFPIIQGGQNGPVIMLIHTNCVSQERKDGRRSRKFVWPRNQNPFSREIQGGGEGEMHLWS